MSKTGKKKKADPRVVLLTLTLDPKTARVLEALVQIRAHHERMLNMEAICQDAESPERLACLMELLGKVAEMTHYETSDPVAAKDLHHKLLVLAAHAVAWAEQFED
ncbi:MAG: hypothetical protein JWR69_3037 [Pedosphaera sp.]|nr:hypothetical protein [Pedosphaera sp.]